LTKYIEWFNTTSRWLATLVVSGSTAEARGKAITLLADLGQKVSSLSMCSYCCFTNQQQQQQQQSNLDYNSYGSCATMEVQWRCWQR
jgi:transketolase